MKKKSLRPARFAQANRPFSRISGAIWGLFLLFSLASLFWLFLNLQELDKTIRSQFEQARLWALPARVYARPLEFSLLNPIAQAALIEELRLSRYREDKALSSEGSFYSEKQTVTLRTRSFTFSDGPSPSQIVTLNFSQGKLSEIQDQSGNDLALFRLDPLLLGSFFPIDKQDRELIELEAVPQDLITLLLATEDKRFYEHFGVDILGSLRALGSNLVAGRTVQGGSTITQQLVKNYFLTSARTLERKINEALMAILLESRYSKEAILEAYLNEIYLGQDGARAIHGFGLASQFYFKKNIKDLNLEEMALLVALSKGASYFDPRRHPQRALARRNLVLNNAAAELNAKALTQALAAPLGVVASAASGRQTDFPAYFDLVQRQLKKDYPETVLRSEGLKIFTAFDPALQRIAETVVAEQLPKLEKNKSLPANSLQAAVVITDVHTGEIRALVSDRQAGFPGFNRAVDAQRQIGSTIKPFVYLAALLYGDFHAVSQIRDSELVLDVGSRQLWRPKNYDGAFRGLVPLYEALAKSYNLPAVRLGLAAGLENVLTVLKKAGIEGDLPNYPSVFLGAVELTPLNISQGYQTLAAEGFYTPLRSIREVLNDRDQVQQRFPLRTEQVLDSDQVAPLLMLLTRVFSEGTAQSGRIGNLALAGKTGTTDELRDSWFVGFSAETLTTVWVGRDDNQVSKLTGASGALPIWQAIMQKLPLANVEATVNTQVNYFWADPRNGKLATPDCPGSQIFLFYVEKMPKALSENCR